MPIRIPKEPLFSNSKDDDERYKVKIPKVPLFSKDEKRYKDRKDRKDRRKGHLPGYLDLDKDDRESDYERDWESDYEGDLESDYERDRAYSEFISRREDDEDGGEGGVKEEEKEKEKEKRKKKAIPLVDLFTRMYFERVLFYFGELTNEKANILIALLLYGNIQDSKKKFLLMINSAGGDLNAGVTLYDLIQHSPSGVDTLSTGCAFATAALILSGGKERAATANTRIMIRKPRPPILNKNRKWEDACFEIHQVRDLTRILIEQLAKRTGKSEQIVKNDIQWPKFMSAEEAQIHGIIDSIVDEKND